MFHRIRKSRNIGHHHPTEAFDLYARRADPHRYAGDQLPAARLRERQARRLQKGQRREFVQSTVFVLITSTLSVSCHRARL